MVNSDSLLTQKHQAEALEGTLRSENSGTQRDAALVSREAIPALGSAAGSVASPRAKASQAASGSGVEERSLRVRLSRLILHETQLRQKLSGIGGGAEKQSENSPLYGERVFGEDVYREPTTVQKRGGLKGALSGAGPAYSQNLLDQILVEKQILQRQLDALAKNTSDSGSVLPSNSVTSGFLIEIQQGSEAQQEPKDKSDGEAKSPLQKEVANFSSLDSLESANIDRVNAEQILGSIDGLLSSRQNMIDQYHRDGDLDSLLGSLERQDRYMEAVMSALSPSHASIEEQIKGELVNISV